MVIKNTKVAVHSAKSFRTLDEILKNEIRYKANFNKLHAIKKNTKVSDEKVMIIAKSILEKYKNAFEKLSDI